MRKHIVVPGSVAAFLAATGLAGAEEPAASSKAFSLTAGVDYSTGKYGDASSTDILYVPITGAYEMDKWLFKLTVPYISVTGPGNVVRGIGKLKNKAEGPRRTESGLGDLVGSITRNVVDVSRTGTVVDVTGKVKFGTADASKALGTGENDYAAQVDVVQSITPSITAFGSLGYKVIGVPSGADLHNVFYGEAGGSYKLTEALTAGIFLDVSQAPSTSGPERELTAYLSQKLSDRWKVQAYIVHGFANGSPDWGGGGTLSFKF